MQQPNTINSITALSTELLLITWYPMHNSGKVSNFPDECNLFIQQ